MNRDLSLFNKDPSDIATPITNTYRHLAVTVTLNDGTADAVSDQFVATIAASCQALLIKTTTPTTEIMMIFGDACLNDKRRKLNQTRATA